MRIPLTGVDQGIFHLDQGSTVWSGHLEVRVAGRLDDDRVAAAAAAAAARHPLARARLAPYSARDRELYWEIPDRLDRLAVEVVDCRDDLDVAKARARLITRRLDLAAGPPFALLIAHRPGGDSLLMNLSHTAGDGTSAILLMRSIARAYAGADDGGPGDVVELRDFRAGIVQRPGDRRKAPPRPQPTTGVAVAGGHPRATGLGFAQLRLDKPATAEALGRRRRPATLNDMLLGSLAVAIRRFNDEHGDAPATVSLMMPVDLRSPGGAEDVMSNKVASVSVPVFAGEQSDLESAQLAVAQRTLAVRARRLDGDLINVPPMIGGWPVGAVRLLVRLVMTRPVSRRLAVGPDAAVLTNLGRLDAPFDFGDDAGPTIELWATPPVQSPPGVCLGIGAAMMNDELLLTLRYHHRQFDAPGADRFIEAWRGVLTGR